MLSWRDPIRVFAFGSSALGQRTTVIARWIDGLDANLSRLVISARGGGDPRHWSSRNAVRQALADPARADPDVVRCDHPVDRVQLRGVRGGTLHQGYPARACVVASRVPPVVVGAAEEIRRRRWLLGESHASSSSRRELMSVPASELRRRCRADRLRAPAACRCGEPAPRRLCRVRSRHPGSRCVPPRPRRRDRPR